jgi:hypothetical protein
MILIVELIFLVGGLWALVTGKLPTALFNSGGRYTAEGPMVRVIGLLLIAPLPLAFLAGVVMGLLFGEPSPGLAILFEIVLIVAAAVLSMVIFYRIRRPVEGSAGPVVSKR